MSINTVPTAEVIESMASRLQDSAKELERLAARIRDTKDLELAGDAANVIANLLSNLRIDLLESIARALPPDRDTALAELAKAAPKSTWPHYSLELTEAHAQATAEALDLYARIGIGQFQVLAEQIAYGLVPVGGVAQSAERVPASPAQCDKIRELCDEMKSVMNFPGGGSNGIGHKHNAAATHAAWEVKKVLDQTMAIKRNPHPDFRGVNYDGLVLRYTDHPAPVATYRKRKEV